MMMMLFISLDLIWVSRQVDCDLKVIITECRLAFQASIDLDHLYNNITNFTQ